VNLQGFFVGHARPGGDIGKIDSASGQARDFGGLCRAFLKSAV